ncbi:L-type lectin-domain containing receptor kinase V.9-like [Prosopis cineraria]|uniref:L-type lectin-domain containing receptor kinase V.9-like n=1 Tax=Prosopis cineraria TaxID=364024 RepID=UPI0024100DB6|nr:L-type lectin-domain containing receptor kinase V.9-like [Prosopis cineraria]XP_054805212.1 L-type lectin-domain containing receptor kinase V.9-like [Prosopis cineraria]
MSIIIFMLCLYLNIAYSDENVNNVGFRYDGYFKLSAGSEQELRHSNLTAKAIYADSGLSEASQVFYNLPLRFKNSNATPSVFSFSTTFIFAIVATDPEFHGHGLALAISPTRGIPQAQPNQYLGLFNATNNGESYNHIVAIELDTDEDFQFHDIDDNHLGIDINGLDSVNSSSAAYYNDRGRLRKLDLTSGEPMQVWVEYDSKDHKLSVTIHPINIPKPEIPLLTLKTDLSSIFSEFMFVGFSSSTDSNSSHYILGWNFRMNGQAEEINLSRLPDIPGILDPNEIGGGKGYKKVLIVISPLVVGVVFLLILIYGAIMISRRRKFIQVLEDWQILYGPHRFTYKDLFIATKGFRDGQLLGRGGFGRVYRGTLPFSNVQIAVKRISHDSRQGMKEFIAEIATIGRLRHPNLVRLLGYCRRKNELLLVYDYMPNGSLDKFLYRMPNSILSWKQRFKIIKDVASGLLYLHQQWVQVIVHRDIKPANVLIDNDMNARLGDFGLAKLWDHGNDPQTSHVAGTPGYIDPEIVQSGKSSTCTDIYSFGVFLLEVACGRRPIETQTSPEKVLLLEWVMVCLDKGDICEAVDSRLGDEYVVEEADLVLKLGLLCSHPVASARPTISTIVQIFDGDSQLPDNLSDLMKFRKVGGWSGQGCSSSFSTFPTGQTSIASITFTEPFASDGR